MSSLGSLNVARTRWPTHGDYDAALEAAQLGGDAGLAQGLTFERDAVGFTSFAGAAGIVYHAAYRKGQYAFKVFAKEVPDRQERHEYIHEHLKAASSPLFVDFRFSSSGVWVHSAWFPAVRMEWCPGDRLDEALDFAADRGYRPEQWVRAWLGLVSELRRTQTAHGDLQDGNILVEKTGRLRLIDYDGMFVPTMRGRLGAIEKGHSGYQHPERTQNGAPFDEHMDGVSSLVILASLACLTPELWRVRNTEGLILGPVDLAHPTDSDLFERMGRSPAPAGKVVALLKQALERPLGPCPELDEAAQLFGVSLPPIGKTKVQRKTRTPSATESLAEEADFSDLLLPWEVDLEADHTADEQEDRSEEATGRRPTRARPLSHQQVLTLASLGAGLEAGEIASLRSTPPSRVRQQVNRLEARLDAQTPKELIGIQLTRRQAEVVELCLAGTSEAECVDRLDIQPTTVRKHLRAAINRFHQSSVPSAAEIIERLRALQAAAESPPPGSSAPAPVAAQVPAPRSSSDDAWVGYLVAAVITLIVLYLLFG
jgi:DNA-binding CsgD family transcriptional regulator